MDTQDASKEDRCSLEKAQYEYRKMIYFEGLKILESFPEAVIGRDPSSGESIDAESRGGAGEHAHGPPPGQHIYGPPPGQHIYGPPPPPPSVGCGYGPPPGVHIYIYGPPPGLHIYGPPPPPPSLGCGYGPPPGGYINGPPPGGYINGIINLVEAVLSLKPPPKPPK